MPKLRYAIAALFFAASVGCSALWWRSFNKLDRLFVPVWSQPKLLLFASGHGIGTVSTLTPPKHLQIAELELRLTSAPPLDLSRRRFHGLGHFSFSYTSSQFGLDFPLWYASLAFALTGVAALRIRRQFSIRSALIVTTIVAAFIGTAVVL